MENMQGAAKAFSEQHGITEVQAEDVLTSLGLGTGELERVASHPEHTAALKLTGSRDRQAGQAGWLVWFADAETAIAVSNADAVHGEQLGSLADAVAWAQSGMSTIDPDEQCAEHGCARATCSAQH